MAKPAGGASSSDAACTLFVRNLSLDTTKEDLVQFFSEIGPVRRGIIVSEKKSRGGASKGFGFVVFALESDVQEAIRVFGNHTEFQGRKLILEAAGPKGTKKPASASKAEEKKDTEAEEAAGEDSVPVEGGDDGDIDKRAVILFNLPSDFSDHQLRVRIRKLDQKVQSVERDGARARVIFHTPGAAHSACQELDKREWGGATVFARRPQQMAVHSRAKGRCRLIVRNLGFKVNEAKLRAAFEVHGPLAEAVVSKGPDGKSKGFGFVQYVCRPDAVRALAALNGTIELGPKQAAPIAVDFALSKHRYELLKRNGDIDEAEREAEPEGRSDDGSDSEEAGNEDDEAKEKNTDDDESDDKDEAEAEAEAEEEDSLAKSKAEPTAAPATRSADASVDQAVAQQRTLFVQNLLFETPEPAIRERFREFGAVRGVKLVKDASTGRSRGSAFVEFWEPASAQRALQAGNPMLLEGRPVYVALAVDKSTARKLVDGKDEPQTKHDRRHLYLANEGKTTEGVPKSDRAKREAAEAEKKEKLKSPLFFMSPTRLSVRNLNRKPNEAIDSKELKRLALDAAVKGMKQGLVRSNEGDRALFPAPDAPAPWPKVLKATVFLEDDGTTSRGFGFVEFEQHVHALACLRVLNNSPDFAWAAAGGRAAMSHKPEDRPRLIASFSVENAAKVKLQEERRNLARSGGKEGASRAREFKIAREPKETKPGKADEGKSPLVAAAPPAKRARAEQATLPTTTPARGNDKESNWPRATSHNGEEKKRTPRKQFPRDAPQPKKKRTRPETDDVDVLIQARSAKSDLFVPHDSGAQKTTRWFDA